MSNKEFINNLSSTYADVRRLNAKIVDSKRLVSKKGTIDALTVKTINGATPITKVKTSDSEYIGNMVVTRDGTVTISSRNKWVFTDTCEPARAVKVLNNKAIMEDGSIIELDTSLIYEFTNVTGMLDPYNIHEWYGDLPNLIKCEGVSATRNWFLTATIFGENLTTFAGDVPNATKLYSMFRNCHNLSTFIGDLSSLRIAGDKNTTGNSVAGLFEKTNLSLDSVANIAYGIHDFNGETKATGEGMINISWNSLPSDEQLRNDLVEELNIIVNKGWHLQTNAELTAIAQSKGYKISSGEKSDSGFYSGGDGDHGYSGGF